MSRESRRCEPGSTAAPSVGAFRRQRGAPIEAEAYVKVLSDGQFILRNPMGAGRLVNLGPMARLVIGNVDAVEVRGNGSIQDLSGFQRANVARFTVSSDGSIAPHRQ